MQQNRVKKRKQQILLAGILSSWLFIGLCVIQLMRVQAQLNEQKELLKRTDNLVQLLLEEAEAGNGNVTVSTAAVNSSIKKADTGQTEPETIAYPDLCGLEQVDKPEIRSHRQVLKRLEELGAEDIRIGEIYKNSAEYPDKLLEALANNPEMADFVLGYPESQHEATGGLTQQEKEKSYPLFLQWDPRWGYVSYGDDSCIALSGCGPTCLAMTLYYLTGNDTLTPDRIAGYSMENGYYLSGTGTLWTLFEDVAPIYGVNVGQPEVSEQEMKAALDQGSILICSMSPGDFTVGGHFVVVYGYDQDGFFINDPNCVARSREKWNYDRIGGQIKHLWVFSRSTKQGDLTDYRDAFR